MALLVKQGTFTVPTSGGTGSVSVGWQPKAVIFFGTARTAQVTSPAANPDMFFGVAADHGGGVEGNFGQGFVVEDAGGSSDSDGSTSPTDSIVVVRNNAGTNQVDARGKVTAFTATGFDYDFTVDLGSSAWIVSYLAIGGDLTNAFAGTFSPTTTTDGGTQDVTAPGFQPDLVIAFSNFFETTAGAMAADATLMLGASDGVNQGCAVWFDNDAANTMTSVGAFTATAAIRQFTSAGGDDATATIVMLSTGFRVTWTAACASTANDIYYLALKGLTADVLAGNTRTTVGVGNHAGHKAFTPLAALFAATRHAADGYVTALPGSGSMGVGATDGTAQASVCAAQNDGNGTGGADGMFQTDLVVSAVIPATPGPGTIGYEGAHSAFRTDGGVNVNYTTVEASARRILVITLGSPPVVSSTAYRFRHDNGGEAAATWRAAVNTAPPSSGADAIGATEVFRLRFDVRETNGGDPASQAYMLEYQRNGGGWNQVFDIDLGVEVILIESPNVTNGQATTQQITSGTFQAGTIQEDQTAVPDEAAGITHNLPASTITELEFVLSTLGLVGGDTFALRLLGVGGVLRTTATVTVETPAATSLPLERPKAMRHLLGR